MNKVKKTSILVLTLIGSISFIVAGFYIGIRILDTATNSYTHYSNYSDAQVDGVVEYGWPKIVPKSVTEIYRYTPKDDVCLWMRFMISIADKAIMTQNLRKLSEIEVANLKKSPSTNSFWQKITEEQPDKMGSSRFDFYIGKAMCDTCYPVRDAYVAFDRDSDIAYYWCE